MSKIDGGATLWARQTIESDIFYNKPHAWFKIWFYLVNKANHKDNKLFKRGTCFMKYEWIMEKTKATSSQIKHCIEYLKHARQIATQKKTRGLLVTIIKYDFYQTLNNYYYAESQTERKTKGKQKENKSHTINKNDKNDKNLEKDIKKERQVSDDENTEKPKKEVDPLEFSFTDKCWYELNDWRIKMYSGRYPKLSINFLLEDVYRRKFLSDPNRYQKEIAIAGGVEKLVWMWLGQDEKYRKIKEAKLNMPETAKGGTNV